MRINSLFAFLQKCLLGWPLYFGGGGGGAPPAPVAPPEPAPVAAPMRADSQGAKRSVKAASKRRIGGMDAMQGDVLGSMSRNRGFASTLGGSAQAYTGEP